MRMSLKPLQTLALILLTTTSAFAASPVDPTLASARNHKAMFDDAEAIDDYTKYLKTHAWDESVRLERAEEYVTEHRFDESIADYKILLKSKQPRTVMYAATQLGKVYQTRGNYKEAIATYRLARAAGADTLLSEISECALAMGDAKAALDTSNEMMQHEPIPARQHRANAYLALHRPKDALSDYNYIVNYYQVKLARSDKESRIAAEYERIMASTLLDRAKCYDLLKDSLLAKKDREKVRTVQESFYNDTPFSIKDKK